MLHNSQSREVMRNAISVLRRTVMPFQARGSIVMKYADKVNKRQVRLMRLMLLYNADCQEELAAHEELYSLWCY